ncbi:MAG TPA: hypothetical protein VHY37_12090 [Tepidisphaeraceae bacterium]|nr:hypothetical protein [Tepidisphaeraceae bacterium]
MARYIVIATILLAASALMAQSPATAPATMPSADAYALYKKADAMFRDLWTQQKIESPSNSNDTFPPYPPFGAEWLAMEKTDYIASGAARDLVHQAAAIDHADWPVFDFSETDVKGEGAQLKYLSQCRDIANNLRDAALYQSLYLNDQPAAIHTLQDSQHMALLLQNQPNKLLVRELVAQGIYALNVLTSNTIISDVRITSDPANRHDLPESLAKQWMADLLDHPSAQAQFDSAVDIEYRQAKLQHATTLPEDRYRKSPITEPAVALILLEIQRLDAERDMSAMSVAAHLYQCQHGRWPANAAELAMVMGTLPIDPFGNGKQSLGYALIPHGLPDGSNRPMVYSREGAEDGLFYFSNRPHYDYYRPDSTKQYTHQKQGGEFRDIARWTPPANTPAGPTTRTLVP